MPSSAEKDSEDWLESIDQPGPDHRRLDALVGEWDAAIKLWDDGPDEPPLQLQGTTRRRWALKGRFLFERSNHPMDSEHYHSVAFLGFNRLTSLFEHVWIDSESTCMFFETGRYDPAADLIRILGSHTDPETGFVTQTRTEIKITGPDSHVKTGYATEEDGREYKEIEVRFTRSPTSHEISGDEER